MPIRSTVGAGVDSICLHCAAGTCVSRKKLEASLPWPARAGKIFACTVPQAQVKMATNPQRPVHALLGGFLLCQACWLKKTIKT